RCQACHRPGEAAPFSLLTYEDAARHGAMIKEVTAQRRMPPWGADPRYGQFRNDCRLTRAEIETLVGWVDGGLPCRDGRDLPKPIAWPDGWSLGKPDMVVEMPEEFEVPAEGRVPLKQWIIETGFREDKWVQMTEARPGARGVVHHIFVTILPEGSQPDPQ